MEEERIGLFIDYENLAIGAREDLGIQFDFKPVADALAERGRVVVRRAYADWTYFEKDRRMLTENQIELIEIPQRKGAVRKNAADIKMAVDAVELAFERGYVTMFVLCTGDSDFTPLVHKLRELNKRVIGVGIKHSTSKMLPPACDFGVNAIQFYMMEEGMDFVGDVRVKGNVPCIKCGHGDECPMSAVQMLYGPEATVESAGIQTFEAQPEAVEAAIRLGQTIAEYLQ